MAHLDERATALIREVKAALRAAHDDLAGGQLTIKSVELDLKATLEIDAGGKFSLFKILTFEAKHTHAQTQTISVSFAPPTGRERLLPTIKDELTQAIVVVAAAAQEAAAEPPQLELSSATVSLEVAVTNEGSVEVFATGAVSDGNTHTLTIGLAPTTA